MANEMIERVAAAIEAAQCNGREGPYGLYDYSDYPGNTAPYRVRDFRDPASNTYGNHVFKSVDRNEAKAEFERLTREHIARAAIEAMREPTEHMEMVGCQMEPYGVKASWHAMIDGALE